MFIFKLKPVTRFLFAINSFHRILMGGGRTKQYNKNLIFFRAMKNLNSKVQRLKVSRAKM